MDNPFFIFFWLILTALAAAVVWFPRYGLLARWRVHRQSDQRQRLEDALKIIFNLQQEGQPPDKFRLAVELKLDLPKVQALIARLEAQKLVKNEHSHLQLTTEGQRWAIQVIRAHRLWERYLADEARMPLEKIHSAAHQREHQMTVAEVNHLDAALGHPTQDPHGDPIPNAAGVLRDIKVSTPLISLQPGQRGKIAHLEDEPPLAYAQLLAEGLYVGQSIIVQENSPARVVLSGDESQYMLAQAIAENVSVHLDVPEEQPDPAVIPLGSLPSRERAEIVRIDERCQGFTRRRFLDLGLTPGTPIFPELENAFNDPRAYRVRGTLIALRRDQAGLIWVR
ncbi:MAG: FeoA domain-containing protein, partial [Anaerolineaceae bacterium]|nr:FeoA domain-containing protein [Anaerolineaceae bacterium]